jgi:hypothetical protein
MNTFVQHPSHAPHSVPAIQAYPGLLHVITCLFNPLRYRARYRHFRAFEKHMADSGAILTTVECAFGGRPFEITDPANPRHIQVRTKDELWLKENLMNIGISRLPADAEYVAVIDADIAFMRPDWAQETLQMLQHHPAVQIYSELTYLGPEHEPLHRVQSFFERWCNGEPLRIGPDGLMSQEVFFNRHHHRRHHRHDHHHHGFHGGYGNGADVAGQSWGQPGGAWAYRREALDQCGGLLDFAILGSADSLMAYAMLNHLGQYLEHENFSPGYKAELFEWQRRALPAFRQNIGVVRTGACHYWHGSVNDRRYGLRNSILKDNGFDPRRDLKRDTQGVWRLHDDGSQRYVRLRDGIRSYFAGRNEDSIDDSMYLRT